jgi:hypothetical protein
MIRFLTATLVVLSLSLPSLAEDKAKSTTATTTADCCKDGKCCCSQTSKSTEQRVFELRTYYTNPGKLTDLHKRFRDHTCKLLEKHGATLVGFWTPREEKDGKESKLIYLVAFPSREAARKTWKEFGEDPEWQKVYAESHKNGVLVGKVESVYLDPTDYSASK